MLHSVMKHDAKFTKKIDAFLSAVKSNLDAILKPLGEVEKVLKNQKCHATPKELRELDFDYLSHDGLSIYGQSRLGFTQIGSDEEPMVETGYFAEFNTEGWFAIGVYTGTVCHRYLTRRFKFSELGKGNLANSIIDEIFERGGEPTILCEVAKVLVLDAVEKVEEGKKVALEGNLHFLLDNDEELW